MQITLTKYIIMTYNENQEALYLTDNDTWIHKNWIPMAPRQTETIKKFASKESAKNRYRHCLKFPKLYPHIQDYPMDKIIVKPVILTANLPK